MLEALFELAAQWQLDVSRSEDILALADGLLELEDDDDTEEGFIDDALAALSDFAFFRMTITPSRAWEFVLDQIEEMRDGAEDDPLRVLLDEAREAGAAVSDSERAAVLESLAIVDAVPQLLDWVGDGRDITQTGGIRRADIAEVAALLGISAIGVAKRTASKPGEPLQVRSATELPALSAWWEALPIADLLERTATKVRPGHAAEGSVSGGALSGAEQVMLVGTFISEVVLQATDDDSLAGQMIAAVMMSNLARIAAGRPPLPEPDGADETARIISLMRTEALGALDPLVQVGILSTTPEGELWLDPALSGVVAMGVLLARTLVDRRFDDLAE